MLLILPEKIVFATEKVKEKTHAKL